MADNDGGNKERKRARAAKGPAVQKESADDRRKRVALESARMASDTAAAALAVGTSASGPAWTRTATAPLAVRCVGGTDL